MHYSVFKTLPGWLVDTFEHLLLIGQRDQAIELADTMCYVHAFLRGSAFYNARACLAAAKTGKARRFNKLINANGIYIQ